MPTRLGLIAVAALTGSLVLSMQCGSSSPCTPSTCPTGCCDSTATCQTGVDDTACGRGGVSCASCPAGQSCSAQVCAGGSGGGLGVAGGSAGGSAGRAGGSGGGAGGGLGTCRAIGTFTGAPEYAGYDPTGDYAYGAIGKPDPNLSSTTTYARASLEYDFGFGATVPSVRHFDGGQTIADCDVCVYYDEGCDPADGSCSKNFLMQSGDVDLIAGDANERVGRIAGSASNLTFVQWDYSADAPVTPGECVTISHFALDLTWDAGLGVDGGSPDGG